MQFITNGPDIPDALLQAHEDGRVVFFCGAGISYPAGLPGFKGLVDSIYHRLGTMRTPIEEDAYCRGQFDATLDLLERRIPGQRIAVRTALAQALRPKLRKKEATDTHTALLQLARSREGAMRLVTTNFDRIFEHVAKRTKQPCGTYAAPMLPIPKNSRWDGVVYLHGLLPAKPDNSVLHRLVLTSGDFGLAYLTERWAARFVSELFRNYVVCFVGYSINDPVLRYMMDALAADRMLGEITPQAYALGDCEPGLEHDKTIEWEAKGVIPILYEVPKGDHYHSALHRTLKAWAETYRDGALGKERIVVDYALARPSASTRQDDFVGRMLWALSHKSGLPAKRFADFNPVPRLEWLEAFCEDRYLHGDLSRFNVPPRAEVDSKLRFSLCHRPAPYHLTPWMALVSGNHSSGHWDETMSHLARWLTRHLNDPALILWLAERGGKLHVHLSSLIEHELDRFSRLEQEGKMNELEEIRVNSPNAIPVPMMRTLWRLMLTGRVKSPWRELDLYRWKNRLRRDRLTATLRLELRELLAPKITLKNPFRWDWADEGTKAESHVRMKDLVDWELVLAADHVHATFRDLNDDSWQEALHLLFDDFQQLLLDALDLRCELAENENRSDRSYWHLPSINPHWQNRVFHDWVTLIELLRDAWLALRNHNPARAIRAAQSWFYIPYSTFKRMALYAASQDNCIDSEQWVEWLLADDAYWLWSVETKRETMRLMVLQGIHLSTTARESLEEAILAGPPRYMFRKDLEPKEWTNKQDYSIWQHLAKLSSSGINLGDAARERLDALSVAYPKWQLEINERDEFSHWRSGTGFPNFEKDRQIGIAPRKRLELFEWLKLPTPDKDPFYEDTWLETCGNHVLNSLFALWDLALEGQWPTDRWRDALQAWSKKGRIKWSWRYAAPLIQIMPDKVLQEINHAVTWWLQSVSKSIQRHEDILLELCNRVLSLPPELRLGIEHNGERTDQPVMESINNPIGHVTQALLNLWLKREPNDNDQLPVDIEPIFIRLCDTSVEHFRHGRVLLAANLIALFRVDRVWVEKNLFPLLDWQVDSTEARAAWEGFLWSPRLYQPLLVALKSQFLETTFHYDELIENNRHFVVLLTHAALQSTEGYTTEDFRKSIGALPKEGLQEVAQALVQALEGAGDQRAVYWKSRIQPFWQYIWPKLRDLANNGMANELTQLCIAAGAEFPSALMAVQDWLLPVEHPDYLVHVLYKSDLCHSFPGDALKLLNAILIDQRPAPHDLGDCLHAIVQADPELEQDHRYQRLDEYWRRLGV